MKSDISTGVILILMAAGQRASGPFSKQTSIFALIYIYELRPQIHTRHQGRHA